MCMASNVLLSCRIVQHRVYGSRYIRQDNAGRRDKPNNVAAGHRITPFISRHASSSSLHHRICKPHSSQAAISAYMYPNPSNRYTKYFIRNKKRDKGEVKLIPKGLIVALPRRDSLSISQCVCSTKSRPIRRF